MSRILFVLEGSEAEPKVLDALWPMFFHDSDYIAEPPKVVYTFNTHIYQLYKCLKADDGLGLIGVLKERDKSGTLENEDEESFESVYLIFDYDGHVNMPRDPENPDEHLNGDDILSELLEFFDDETNNGKLFLSYPMVEAVRHLDSQAETVNDLVLARCKGPRCPNIDCVDRSTCPPVRSEYKGLVPKIHPEWINISEIPPADWIRIIKSHLGVNEILKTLSRTGLASDMTQANLFAVQRSVFISRQCPKVAVLSAFPIFLLDYFGGETLQEMLDRI